MKICSTVICLLFFHLAFSQNNADAIVGVYLSQDGYEKIEIYKADDKFSGKIIWLDEPNDPKTKKPYTDTKNPDKNIRTQPLINLVIIRDLQFVEDNMWKGGKIYDPYTGKTRDCKATVKGKRLKIRGYLKLPFFGSMETWTKVK